MYKHASPEIALYFPHQYIPASDRADDIPRECQRPFRPFRPAQMSCSISHPQPSAIGELAQTQGESQAVKDFGKLLVADHGSLLRSLTHRLSRGPRPLAISPIPMAMQPGPRTESRARATSSGSGRKEAASGPSSLTVRARRLCSRGQRIDGRLAPRLDCVDQRGLLMLNDLPLLIEITIGRRTTTLIAQSPGTRG